MVTQSLNQAAVTRMESYAILDVASSNCISLLIISNYSKMKITSGSKLPANIGDFGLDDTTISGIFPECIGSLTNLETLSLDRFDIGGTISEGFICKLSKLKTIRLFETKVFGLITLCFGDLKNLEELALYRSLMSGPFPVSLCKLVELKYFSVAYTDVNGEIPDCVGDIIGLQVFEVSETLMSGPIPQSM
jgi:hypothetical protein